MEIFYLTIGILLLVLGILDFLWTTLWVNGGAGPVTNRLSSLTWSALRKISGDHPKVLSLSGPVVLLVTLVTWIFFLWTGWTFVFAGYEQAIINSSTQESITWIDRIYFAGYLIFTLGNGDFKPNDGFWQIATVLASGSGFLGVTLGVTYFLNVLEAVNQKQALALNVYGAGENSIEIVKNAWNGHDLHNIDLLLNDLSSQLNTLIVQHNSYPVLHYYQADKKQEALPLAIVILDEAMTIIEYGVKEAQQPNLLLVQEVRSSIKNFLETLTAAFIQPAEKAPPYADLDAIQLHGIPTVSNVEYQEALRELEDQRRKLVGLLQENARQWPAGNDK